MNELLAGVTAPQFRISPLDLLAQILENLQPSGLHGVIDRSRMNVRPGDGKMHLDEYGRRLVRAALDARGGGGDHLQFLQITQTFLDPHAHNWPGVESFELYLGCHELFGGAGGTGSWVDLI